MYNLLARHVNILARHDNNYIDARVYIEARTSIYVWARPDIIVIDVRAHIYTRASLYQYMGDRLYLDVRANI